MKIHPFREGMYAGGVVATTFAGMSLATGITLTAVGYGVDSGGMKTAGLITGVAGAIGLYGGIYLMPGDPGRDLQRLDAAAAVYGLSTAQRLVAGYLVEGMPAPEIAKAMGVRPATVRTHVERMFVKTGVHNQTALVRVLLSAAAPL